MAKNAIKLSHNLFIKFILTWRSAWMLKHSCYRNIMIIMFKMFNVHSVFRTLQVTLELQKLCLRLREWQHYTPNPLYPHNSLSNSHSLLLFPLLLPLPHNHFSHHHFHQGHHSHLYRLKILSNTLNTQPECHHQKCCPPSRTSPPLPPPPRYQHWSVNVQTIRPESLPPVTPTITPTTTTTKHSSSPSHRFAVLARRQTLQTRQFWRHKVLAEENINQNGTLTEIVTVKLSTLQTQAITSDSSSSASSATQSPSPTIKVVQQWQVSKWFAGNHLTPFSLSLSLSPSLLIFFLFKILAFSSSRLPLYKLYKHSFLLSSSFFRPVLPHSKSFCVFFHDFISPWNHFSSLTFLLSWICSPFLVFLTLDFKLQKVS